MTGHKGNSEFCFPEAEGNIEVEGKQNSLFPEGSVIKCFVIPPDSKIEKAPKNLFAWGHCIHWLRSQNWAAAKTKLFYRKISITAFFFAANKKYSTKVALASSNA